MGFQTVNFKRFQNGVDRSWEANAKLQLAAALLSYEGWVHGWMVDGWWMIQKGIGSLKLTAILKIGRNPKGK